MASAERDRAYKWASGGCAPSGGYALSGVQGKAPGQGGEAPSGGWSPSEGVEAPSREWSPVELMSF
jgi:hypothetical protein